MSISQIQKSNISNRILKKYYINGIIPKYSEFISKLYSSFSNKKFGFPLFTPRGAVANVLVDPKILKDNITEIKDDVDIVFTDLNQILTQQVVVASGINGQYNQLLQRLNSLNSKLDSILNVYSGTQTLFDNFSNTSKIDLSQTTAFVDTSLGEVTLPISTDSSVKYSSNNIKLVNETYSSGYKSYSGSFLSVFSDYSNQTWQGVLDTNGFYQAEINLTGQDVGIGTSNEVQVNKISVIPINPLNIKIEASTDGLNWDILENQYITLATSFDIPPTWILFLRFTISGNTVVGINNISIGNVSTSTYGLLYSTIFAAQAPINNFVFSTDQVVPYGSTLNHYIQNGNTWLQIYPGNVNLNILTNTVVTFGSSGDLVADNTQDPTTLYEYEFPSGNSPIVNSGELDRGIGQFKAEAFTYNFAAISDGNHIPKMLDWNSNLGTVHSCYMGNLGTNSIDSLPVGLSNGSFLFTYNSSGQSWWGTVLRSTTGSVLQENYNYRLTTYIYSDRNTLISNFAGGVYVRDPNNSTNEPSSNPVNPNAYGWSFYINDNLVSSDNKFYSIQVPGSGALLSTQAVSFPISLQVGWNKIQVLIYVPAESFIDSTISSGFNLFLLFRPNLFTFSLSNIAQLSTIPTLISYPIWADGLAMQRVSEFYLKWNTAPRNNNRWAWRLDPTSGTPVGVLLNYDSTNIISTSTIDGKFSGSNPIFNLRYNWTSQPITSLAYKAEFKRSSSALLAPKLKSYKFLITQ
jgi:hypothetical protein